MGRLDNAQLQPYHIRRYKNQVDAKEHANLIVSDLHYGGRETADRTLGLCEYSPDIAKARVISLVEKFIHIMGILKKSYKFNILNIFMLGDMVDGEAMWMSKPGGLLNVSIDGAEQLFGCVDILSWALAELSKEFVEVRVYCLIGNHARATNDGSYLNNFDYFIYRILQKKFAGTHIRIFPMRSWLAAFTINGHLVAACHGDFVESYSGFPFYGITRDTLKIIGMLNKIPEYMLLGHFHNRLSFNVSQMEILVNGSMIGGTAFGIRKVKAVERPMQFMFGMHKKQGLSWQFQIRLDEVKKLNPDNNGILTPYDKNT
jgi:hypothetical protein